MATLQISIIKAEVVIHSHTMSSISMDCIDIITPLLKVKIEGRTTDDLKSDFDKVVDDYHKANPGATFQASGRILDRAPSGFRKRESEFTRTIEGQVEAIA